MTEKAPPAPAPPPAEPKVQLDDVLAEMDDRTRVGWDAAYARAENRKLRAELTRLSNDTAVASPAEGGSGG